MALSEQIRWRTRGRATIAVRPATPSSSSPCRRSPVTWAWSVPPPPVWPPGWRFTLDEIEDLRIAVDEACVMLLSLPGRTRRSQPR